MGERVGIGSVRWDGARDWVVLGGGVSHGCWSQRGVWMDARPCGCGGRLRWAALGTDVGAE